MNEEILIKCPQCGSIKIWKNGYVIRISGKKQRYQCQKCGHIFNED